MSDVWDIAPEPVPELIDDRDLRSTDKLQLLDHDWTTRKMRPATVLAALMQQAPGDPLDESVEEMVALHEAVAYAADCINAEDTYVLNAIDAEGITYDELGTRLGVHRSRAWRLHERAMHRLRTLLLNHPPVRERLNMEPTWNAAAMHELVYIAGYEEDWPEFMAPIPAGTAAQDVATYIGDAVIQLNDGFERYAVTSLTIAAQHAVDYLRSVGKWSLLGMHELLCSKQNDYGHGNILKFGMTGVMVRASDKAERLKNLTASEGVKPRNETLLDSYLDVIGYAVIAQMLKAETFELSLEDDGPSGAEREQVA